VTKENVMTNPNPPALATHLLDQLDGAMAELVHYLATGERVECGRCDQVVPATAAGVPVRHQVRRQWCEAEAG
jgi:hypothetical protein